MKRSRSTEDDVEKRASVRRDGMSEILDKKRISNSNASPKTGSSREKLSEIDSNADDEPTAIDDISSDEEDASHPSAESNGSQAAANSGTQSTATTAGRGSIYVHLVLPADVHLANMMNNTDVHSGLMASLMTARAVTISDTIPFPHGSQTNNAETSDENEGRRRNSEENNEVDLAASSSNSDRTPFLSTASMRLMLKYVLLEELLMANQVWNRPKDIPSVRGSCASDFTRDDFYNTMHFIYSSSIEQHSMLHKFKELPISDQLVLMNAHLPDINRCRFAIKHDTNAKKTTVQYPAAPLISSEISKHRLRIDYHKEIGQFRIRFAEKYRSNETILVILTALALFNPQTPGVTCPGLVDQHRREYLQLLKHYLESTFGGKEHNMAFNFLITWLNWLCMFTEAHGRGPVLYELDPTARRISKLDILFASET